MSESEWIDIRALPFELLNYDRLLKMENTSEVAVPEPTYTPSAVMTYSEPSSIYQAPTNANGEGINLKTASSEAEYEVIINALKKVNFNKSKAATLLGIDRKTLYNKMKNSNIV